MTRDETINYIGVDGKTYTDQPDRDLAIIEFAEDRGWGLDMIEVGIVVVARAKNLGIEQDEFLDQFDMTQTLDDLAPDVERIARGAVWWLNDQGLLPTGYGYDDERATDGYGQ